MHLDKFGDELNFIVERGFASSCIRFYRVTIATTNLCIYVNSAKKRVSIYIKPCATLRNFCIFVLGF